MLWPINLPGIGQQIHVRFMSVKPYTPSSIAARSSPDPTSVSPKACSWCLLTTLGTQPPPLRLPSPSSAQHSRSRCPALPSDRWSYCCRHDAWHSPLPVSHAGLAQQPVFPRCFPRTPGWAPARPSPTGGWLRLRDFSSVKAL